MNHDGVHFTFRDVAVRPKPLQKPHPPVWMAALTPPSFVQAGRKGFNLLCAPVFGFGGASAIELLASYRQALGEAGHDPATKEIAALCMIYCADSTTEAQRDFAEPVIWGESGPATSPAPTAPPPRSTPASCGSTATARSPTPCPSVATRRAASVARPGAMPSPSTRR